MFASGFKEAGKAKDKPIKLPTVPSKELGCVLDCLYSGELELSNEIVYDVLPVAHMLQLTNIVSSCTEFLIQEMSVNTCIRNSRLADEYKLHQVGRAAENFIMSNFLTVSSTEKFKENIGLQFLARGLSISHEICRIS